MQKKCLIFSIYLNQTKLTEKLKFLRSDLSYIPLTHRQTNDYKDEKNEIAFNDWN